MKTNVGRVPCEIMEVVRADVLKRLENSTVGISGANVVAAEEGSIVLVHNEGNISLVSLKDLHIIVAGIDKFVPVLEDAMSVAKLETVYATGNYVTSYINVISGPSKTADIEKNFLKICMVQKGWLLSYWTMEEVKPGKNVCGVLAAETV